MATWWSSGSTTDHDLHFRHYLGCIADASGAILAMRGNVLRNEDVHAYFENKEHVPSPLTEELIAGGFRQRSGGYMAYARSLGIESPTQYWHLIESWCARRPSNRVFGKNIKCGELIFWMAEVSGAVSADELESLKNDVLNDPTARARANDLIQRRCFDEIAAAVEASV